MLNSINISTKLKDSINTLMENDRAAMSNNAGSSFPTENLYEGMRCYRTDLNHIYILTDENNATWELETDFNRNNSAGESFLKLGDNLLIQFSTNGYSISNSELSANQKLHITFKKKFKEPPLIILNREDINVTHPEWSLVVSDQSVTTDGFDLVPTFNVKTAMEEVLAAKDKAKFEHEKSCKHGRTCQIWNLETELLIGYRFNYIAIGKE